MLLKFGMTMCVTTSLFSSSVSLSSTFCSEVLPMLQGSQVADSVCSHACNSSVSEALTLIGLLCRSLIPGSPMQFGL